MITFRDWLQRQVEAEGHDEITSDEVIAIINAMSNVTLLEYFACYQRVSWGQSPV